LRLRRCQLALEDPKHHLKKGSDRFWHMWQCKMWLNLVPTCFLVLQLGFQHFFEASI
jgi:hypothetical protein